VEKRQGVVSASIVQEPCILDGDDRLRGKVPHERDLFVGKGSDFGAVDKNSAD
jgi:hypothetical protein